MLTSHARDLDLAAPLAAFAKRGVARLGPVLTDQAAATLAERAQALMTGDAAFPGIFYQHDAPNGCYENVDFRGGWVGPSPRYRKLDRLQLDPLFLQLIENPLFERLAKTVLGDSVALYRAVLWNKAPHVGMAVPWHQDDGRFWGLDRAPFLQLWVALDDAPVEAGCLEVVPGSHHGGLATAEGGTIPADVLVEAGAAGASEVLPAVRGDCILVHNHTWHRTGRNHTAAPRRAVSISLLGGDVGCKRRRRAPRQFQRLFVDS